MVVVSSQSSSGAGTPVVVKISPMAHFAVGFFALGLLALVLTEPVWFAPLLILPIAASVAILRYRTVADRDTVTARSLLLFALEAESRPNVGRVLSDPAFGRSWRIPKDLPHLR